MKTKQISSLITLNQIARSLIIVILLMGYKLSAQTDFLLDLYEQQTHYDSVISIHGADSMKGTGYVQYQRWLNYWAPKLLPDKDYKDYHLKTIDNAKDYIQERINIEDPNWHLIGPNGNTTGTSSIALGPGQIHFICKDPHYNSGNYFLASSPTGGLFRSIDGGDSWTNAGTDNGLFKCGVSSIVVDSLLPGTWYVTTGNGEAYGSHKIWQNSIGVWRTKDFGNEWENIGLDRYIDTLSNDTTVIFNMRKAIQVSAGSNTKLLVTTTSGLFLTENAVDNEPYWELLIPGDFYDVEKDLRNSNIAYASGSDTTGVYKINILTKSYEKILNPDTITPFNIGTMEDANIRRLSLEISPVTPDYLFAIYTQKTYSYSKLLRFDTESENWVSKGELPRDQLNQAFNGYERSLGWDLMPDTNRNGQLCLIGSNVKPYKMVYNCLDNQDTAKIIELGVVNSKKPHDDCHYIWIDGEDIWAGTDGGIVLGELVNDSTIDWIARNNGLGVSNIENIAVSNSSKLVTSGQFDCGSNTYRTTDEVNWEAKFGNGGDGYQTIITNDSNYYLSAQNGMIKQILNGSNNPSFSGPGYYTSCIDSFEYYANFKTYYQNSFNTLYLTGTKNIMKHDVSGWNEFSDFENTVLYPEMGCNRSHTWQTDVYTNNIIYITTRGNPIYGYHYYRVYKYTGNAQKRWELVGNQPINAMISSIETNGSDPNHSVFVSIRDSIYNVVWADSLSNAIWNNISYNLSINNVQQINTILWDQSGLYIGTDRGVFIKKRHENSWSKYGNYLPNVAVKDLKVENDRIYAGTYGRGVWFASAASCFNKGNPDTLTSNSIITAGITEEVYNDIIIPFGLTYTVNGNLKMGVNCKIVVQRGGKLIIDGGLISNACPDFWEGIEVRGNSNALQSSSEQGWVILKNGATIEYAKQGIATIKNDNGYSDLSYAGGIIQADSSNFLNNSISVIMFPYPSAYAFTELVPEDNYSHFKNCTFTYDSTYYFYNDNPIEHVGLSDVRGVLFESNIFQNTVSLAFASGQQRGIGIHSWNSGIKLGKYELAINGNQFNSLNYGIRSYAFSLTNKTTSIDYAEFNHNSTGCYFSAETFMSVTNSAFNITPESQAIPGSLYSGLYLDNCTGYQVEENTFSSGYNTQFANNYKSVGLYINNSGPDNNIIYKNDFEDLLFATVAQNQNRDLDGHNGLQYKCNKFEENYSDISVTWDGQQSTFNGIAENQGSKADAPIAPAGNLFSHSGNINFSDFDNEGEDVIYYLPLTQPNNPVVPNYYSSNSIDLHVKSITGGWSPELGCPSNLVSKTKSELKTILADNASFFTIYTDSLLTMIDEGNTTALNLEVATSTPPETMEIRDELLSASPYLSDTVMISAAEKENVLPNSIITEILTANPQSAKSSKILNKLSDRIVPLNEYEMASINANDSILGKKGILESKKAFYSSQKVQAVNQLIRLHMEYNTYYLNDSIEMELDNIRTPQSYYKQAFCRFNQGDSIGVVSKLMAVNSDFDLTTHHSNMQNKYEDYFELLLALQANDKDLTEIDITAKNSLYSIIQNTNDILQSYCRNILISTDNMIYKEPYVLPDTSTTKSEQITIPFVNISTKNTNYIKLYPNPAREYITFEYQTPLISSDAEVNIYSVSGIYIEGFKLNNTFGQRILDLRNYSSGTYIISILANGKLLQTEKFTKQ